MIKKISIFAVLMGLVLGSASASSPAKATSTTDDYMTGGHPYLTAGVGYAIVWAPTLLVGNTNINEQIGGFAWRVGGGYLQYQDKFAYGAEVVYNGYPATNYNVFGINFGTLDVSGVDLLAVGKYFFTPRFSIHAKVGPSFMMQKFTSAMGGGSHTQNFVSPTIGYGLGYYFTKNVSLQYEGQYTVGNSNNINNLLDGTYHVGVLSNTISINYYF